MFSTFAVNENNDLYLDQYGNLAIATGIMAIMQGCAQAAKTLLGEMVFNINQGLPYFEQVWVGVPNIQQWTAALRSAFFTVPGVIEVVSLITSQDNNTLTYTAVIRTSVGTGTVTNLPQ